VDYSKFPNNGFNPARAAMFWQNNRAECGFNGSKIVLLNDDPVWAKKNTHDNTFILNLNEPETHYTLYPGNYSGTGHHDFNATCIKQITNYEDGNTDDTTAHMFDSFTHTYSCPVRKFDFKSNYWKGGSEEDADYLLFLSLDGKIAIKTSRIHIEKHSIFYPTDKFTQYLEDYNTSNIILKALKPYSWEDFILE
jgi:hypothetical protein